MRFQSDEALCRRDVPGVVTMRLRERIRLERKRRRRLFRAFDWTSLRHSVMALGRLHAILPHSAIGDTTIDIRFSEFATADKGGSFAN